jgi:hypothetical protein
VAAAVAEAPLPFLPLSCHLFWTLIMSWTETELAELRRAYASGTLRVSYDGKSVEYGSAADLLARIRVIEVEIAAAAGRPKQRRSFAAFSKG